MTVGHGRIRAVRAPAADDLAAAQAVVHEHLAPTPIVPLRLPGVPDGTVAKLETMQPTGSFKVRGALAAVAGYTRSESSGRRTDDVGNHGNHGGRAERTEVVTASAGNHGLGVAFAAARLGTRATVVVPTSASVAKVEALRRMDVNLVQHGDDYEAAERHALSLADGERLYVSPYNDPHVVAGQSTVMTEIATQVGEDVTVVVPVGGGGLVAGITLGAGASGAVRVVGAEAAASASVSAAVAAGGIVPVTVGPTLADGLGGNLEPGSITPDLARGRVHSFVQVTEDRIAEAIRLLVTQAGLVVEGAGAVGVAALMTGQVPLEGRPVVVLTGRNIAPATLARLLTN